MIYLIIIREKGYVKTWPPAGNTSCRRNIGISHDYWRDKVRTKFFLELGAVAMVVVMESSAITEETRFCEQ